MFELKLAYLLDLLSQKSHCLEKVHNITEGQNLILTSGDLSPEANAFWVEMNREKQTLIDEIIDLDNLFQQSFSEIDGVFDQAALSHKQTVSNMQALIHDCLEKDVAIRALEQKNKLLIDERKKSQPQKTIKTSKKYILEQYKNNNKKKD